MVDIHHDWGLDLTLGPNGDLGLTATDEMIRQRVLRRLLTSPGDYIWSPSYGAGLAAAVGRPTDPRTIEARVRLQLRLERAVAIDPPPVIRAQVLPGQSGCMLQVGYHNANSGVSGSISVDLSN